MSFSMLKGTGRPVECAGVSGFYLYLLAAGVIGGIMLFFMLHFTGLDMKINGLISVILVLVWMQAIKFFHQQYGLYGYLWRGAVKRLPRAMFSRGSMKYTVNRK